MCSKTTDLTKENMNNKNFFSYQHVVIAHIFMDAYQIIKANAVITKSHNTGFFNLIKKLFIFFNI